MLLVDLVAMQKDTAISAQSITEVYKLSDLAGNACVYTFREE